MSKMKIGILFGSFNPIHNGHLHLAEKTLEELDIDEVWFVISPQNPFKINSYLEDENHRLKMLELSKLCDIEMTMDKPSYTYKTLRKLSKLYPDYEFSLISGSDSINKMKKWKKSEELWEYNLITFIRSGEKIDLLSIPPNVKLTILESDFNLSSTTIRNRIKNNEDLYGYTNIEVIDYIKSNNIFNKLK